LKANEENRSVLVLADYEQLTVLIAVDERQPLSPMQQHSADLSLPLA
jgi:hypothetical protein